MADGTVGTRLQVAAMAELLPDRLRRDRCSHRRRRLRLSLAARRRVSRAVPAVLIRAPCGLTVILAALYGLALGSVRDGMARHSAQTARPRQIRYMSSCSWSRFPCRHILRLNFCL